MEVEKERRREAVDLDDVRPDADDRHTVTLYSTVTVLARLRGWSTFRPRARAMP